MILLAVDTATDACSVALLVGSRLVGRAETVGQKHSERILPMVREVIEEAGLPLTDCDAFAFGAGPGAFTGLRIACSVAQGLAFGAGRPVVAIGNLAALAFAAAAAAPSARRILAAVDARMQEIYWALYAVDGDAVTELSAPSLAAAADFAELCRQHRPDLVGGNALHAFPEQAARIACMTAADARAGADSIVRLAARRFAEGGATAPDLAAPLYVRDRVALTIDERRGAAVNGAT
jgi:tRNA threonylcarbamoyladenosine biosynthesis protein TsaB